MIVERFLATLISNVSPCQHRRRWREEVGDEVTLALEQQRVLDPGERANWYPCGGSCGGLSERQVTDEQLPDGRWLAVCGDEEVNCSPMKLHEADLVMLTVSPPALATWLRRALGATGHTHGFPQHKGVEGLGRLIWEGEDREAILALGGAREGLRRLLEERGLQRTPTVVFIPSRIGLDGDLVARHPPGSLVALADLRDLVSVEAGRLVLVPARSGPQRVLPVREPAGAPYAAEPIVAEVFEATGKRGLSASACALLIEQHTTFDLFLDLTRVVEGSRHPTSRRAPSGEVTVSSLSRHEAEAAAELIHRREHLGRGEFKTVSARAINKLIEGVREALDVKLGRFGWRAFHTIRGETAEKTRWHFNPPATLKFAVLVPLRS